MNVISREAFIEAMKSRECKEFVHPWSKTCVGGVGRILYSSMLGSSKFCLALGALQVAAKGKNITRRQVQNIVEHCVRLSLCGMSLSTIFIGSICAQKKIFGGFNYYTIISVPSFMAGVTIFIVEKKKRHLFISALCCSAMETTLAICGGTSIFKSTPFFMLINSIFMYYLQLWKIHKSDQVAPELWFFSPSHTSAADENEQHLGKHRRPCSHIHSCIKSIIKETSKYFWCGAALETLRIAVTNFKTFVKNPKTIYSSLFQRSVLRLAAFAGLYVFLHKITNCALCRLWGKNTTANTLIAGFVSGLAFYVRPNLSISTAVFVNLTHIMWRYHNLNGKLMKNFPTSEVLFMFVCVLLFCTRVYAPKYSSKFFNNLLTLASNGRSDEMYESFLRLF